MTDAPPAETARDYRGTVFLPATPFPMKADLPKREPQLLDRWRRLDLWARLRARSVRRPKFVLHDGPPYANGHLHIGHALNKILKDVVNRAAQMGGADADYVPGWDCHGLPIEWKVEEEYRAGNRDKDSVPVLDFRAECRAYAAHWLDVQRDEFVRLGVLGDWANRYATMDFAAEAAIARELGKFLLNGSLYRGLRPVMWSPVEKTALAEAEIEYHDHVSPTLYARFRITDAGLWEDAPDNNSDLRSLGASVVIWTTTPWTIPGNRAVAYGPEIDYALLHVGGVRDGSLAVVGEWLLVALSLLPEFCQEVGITSHSIKRVIKGDKLYDVTCRHPLYSLGYDFDVRLYPGGFVTAEQGTGFVHIAPGHGEDDFNLGQNHGLPVPETVNDDGTFTVQAPGFTGLHVFKAHDAIYAAMRRAGTLLGTGRLTHSYPHSWRSKKPVIFRATPQWFIAMDGAGRIRERALAAVAETDFVPEAGRNRLASMVAARPDWCISRQRAWGVPIPVFVEKATGEPLRDAAVVERIAVAFEAEGADAWYKPGAAARFLNGDAGSAGGGEGRDPDDYEQVMDICDVWFESGSTHAFVLTPERGLHLPADLYLEGSDQHRGWFQSSLLEAIGSTENGGAPFKAVLTHGFTLDEQGRKMSKSLGNVTAPQEVTKQYGADILRLWVMNTDVTEDQRIGPEILKQQAELYRRLRNTLRWLLGNLAGFSDEETVPHAELPELERWVLQRLTELDARLRRAAETHDWTGVYPEIHAFCATDLSAFYFDIRKDVLYCDRPDSPRRRAARTVLDVLHRCLTAWLAPVLVFTAEEAWLARFPDEEGSVHLLDFPLVPAGWRDEALAERWRKVREVRRFVYPALEGLRRNGKIGSSLQAAVFFGIGEESEEGEEVSLTEADADLLSEEDWEEVLIVSAVGIIQDASGLKSARPLAVRVGPALGAKCDRCWRVLPEVGRSKAHPTLCLRCEDAVEPLPAASRAAE